MELKTLSPFLSVSSVLSFAGDDQYVRDQDALISCQSFRGKRGTDQIFMSPHGSENNEQSKYR
jgi:hypothetical protein